MAQNFDPIIGSDIMDILNLDVGELQNSRRFAQVQDIIDYFSKFKDYRFKILKIVQGKTGDKVDLVWSWVQLGKEREAKLKSLNPSDFSEDIEKELLEGYLTKDKIKRIETDLDKRQKELEKRKAQEEEQSKYDKKVAKALDESLKEMEKLQKIRETINDFKKVNELYAQ